MTSKDFEAIIIGGGQAGLATAYYLLRAGVDILVLDDQEDAGGAWRHVWPSMTLFSTAEFSSLPGKPMPAYEGFPPSDHVIDYLADYEQRYRIPVERPVHVDRVERVAGGYRLHAGDRSWTAPHVVAATGTWSTPFVPAYPGLFTGTQWHSANYPGVGPFRGSSVAVVGAANSAAQIAAELTGVAEVTWYTRHPPRWMPDEVDGGCCFVGTGNAPWPSSAARPIRGPTLSSATLSCCLRCALPATPDGWRRRRCLTPSTKYGPII